MDTQEIVKSKKIKAAAVAVGVILVALVSFASGVVVGLQKAKFSYAWGENYERNFIGPRQEKMPPGPDFMREPMMPDGPRGFFREFEGRDFRNAHGVAGEIISISDNSIVVKDRDEKESTISVTQDTLIKYRRDDLKITDLKTGDEIVVMGKSEEGGKLNAVLIRVFDIDLKN